MVLFPRFADDGKAVVRPTDSQLRLISAIREKMRTGDYAFEKVPCVLCGGKSFFSIAGKERFGLPDATVVCTNCGLLQTNPRMTAESFSRFYREEYNGLYRKVTSEGLEGYFDHQRRHGAHIYRFISRSLGVSIRGKLVAEIGCGAGGILSYFHQQGNRVIGSEPDETLVAYGRQRGLDLTTDSILREKPDLIIFSHVLEHLSDPVNELRSIRDSLKGGALLYLEVPGVKDRLSVPRLDFLRFLQLPHVYNFSLRTLTGITGRSGLRAITSNESIQTLWEKGDVIEDIESDYHDIIAHLKRLEHIRHVHPLRLKQSVLFNLGALAARMRR